MESSFRLIQMVRMAMMVSIILYVFVAETLVHRTAAAPDANFYFVLTLVAITLVGMIVAVRRLFVLRSEAVLAAHPEDAAALARWRSGHLITYALSEAIGLFGFGLRLLSFALSQVAAFYVVAVVLMMYFGPRRLSNELG